jgi:hypothetical protein
MKKMNGATQYFGGTDQSIQSHIVIHHYYMRLNDHQILYRVRRSQFRNRTSPFS